ncbi:uncharacterized protein LOC123559659 [Mercenaria mercenaria]|uniref:uncharacterized protein LOC123559659 n=1 Tax=Mercenaria mercenaria TaxID=6596 RepID=UPI00234EEC21|nr:uncharacterized protein LOC123559659 [Mercenaria mercenaria]
MELKRIRKKTFGLHLFIATTLLVFYQGTYISTMSRLKLDFNERFYLSPKGNVQHQAGTTKNINKVIQKKRKDAIFAYCKAARVRQISANKSVQLIYSNQFNLSYFAIPKIGSTFIMQMFSVIRYGLTYAESNFSIPRNKVHSTAQKRKLYFYNRTLEETVTIIPVRNPYSRLFSVFVDKVLLPNSIPFRLEILAQKQLRTLRDLTNLTQPGRIYSSGLSVSFQDFLDYALNPSIDKKLLYRHYDSCFARLKSLICNSNHYIIVKQETFETDIQYVLQFVGVDKAEPNTYYRILKSLHESRVEDSIPGLIKVTFFFAEKYAELWTGPIVAELLWQSFQIQGYVSKHLPFPKRYFNNKFIYMNANITSGIFLREMKKGKLSRIQSMKQRKKAMITAYRGLPKTVLRKIQTTYDCDFEAFGYDRKLI